MGVQSYLAGYIGNDGLIHRLINNSGSPQVCSQPYLQALAEGDITGHTPWVKFGYNGALGSAEEDVWSVGGAYVLPATAQQMEVVSSSTDDDSAGTGVQSITIYYLDAALASKSVDVTMDGTTPVATSVSDIFRVQDVLTKTAGTGGKAAGNIDVRHLDNTPIYARIPTGQNRSDDFVYTVPAGKTLYVTNVLLSSGSSVSGRPVSFITKATYNRATGAVSTLFYEFTKVILQDNSIDLLLEMPTKFTAGTVLKIGATSPDGAAYGSVTCRGWIE